jgi:hypothetical protein
MTTEWVWRSHLPAQSPPDPEHPYGIALDVSRGARAACDLDLPYPAPGVGTWIVVCDVCGFSAAITAAGRADDPTKVRFPCKASGRTVRDHRYEPGAFGVCRRCGLEGASHDR